jgi:opacity protein-like surface antigen
MKTTLQTIVTTVVLMVVASNSSYAQRGIGPGWYTSVNYSVGLPTGKTSGFIDRISWRGAGVEAGKFLGDRLSLGLAGSWNVYYKSAGTATLEINPTTTVSGMEFRYINSFPIMAKVNYYLGNIDGFNPYVGLGGGGLYVRQESQIGGLVLENNGWQPGLFPEAGFRIALPRINLALSARYHHGFGTSTLSQLSYLSANIGLVWLH